MNDLDAVLNRLVGHVPMLTRWIVWFITPEEPVDVSPAAVCLETRDTFVSIKRFSSKTSSAFFRIKTCSLSKNMFFFGGGGDSNILNLVSTTNGLRRTNSKVQQLALKFLKCVSCIQTKLP